MDQLPSGADSSRRRCRRGIRGPRILPPQRGERRQPRATPWETVHRRSSRALKGRHNRPPFNRPAPTGFTGCLGSALSGLGTTTDHQSQGLALGFRLSPCWGFKTDSESPHVHLGPAPKWSRFIPKTASSRDPWPTPSPASTRQKATAQGNALGNRPSTDLKALKGRHKRPPFNRPAPTGFTGRLGSGLSGLGTRTDHKSQGVALGYPLSPRWGAKGSGSGKECGGCGFPRGLGNR